MVYIVNTTEGFWYIVDMWHSLEPEKENRLMTGHVWL